MQQFANGLLTDPFFNIGMGLLSAGGWSTTPRTLGDGLAMGLQNWQRAQGAAQQQMMGQMRMRMMQRQMDMEEAKFRQQAAQQKRMAAMFGGPEGSGGMGGLLSPEAMQKARAIYQMGGPGAATQFVTGLLTQKQQADPTSFREYEKAKAQGFAGSYMDFRREIANMKAPRIDARTTVIPGELPMGTALGKAYNDYRRMAAKLGENHPDVQPLKRAYEKLSQEDRSVLEAGQTFDALNPTLADIEKNPKAISELTGVGRGLANLLLPDSAENAMLSPDTQRYIRASREWIAKHLKRESGAAVSNEEFQNTYPQFFPVPGDSPQNIEDKRIARARRAAQLNNRKFVDPRQAEAEEEAALDAKLKAGLSQKPAAPSVAVPQVAPPTGLLEGNPMPSRRPINLPWIK